MDYLELVLKGPYKPTGGLVEAGAKICRRTKEVSAAIEISVRN